ncbi:MAG: hypothetical protein ACREUF_07240, partial [Solimonas sp.]
GRTLKQGGPISGGRARVLGSAGCALAEKGEGVELRRGSRLPEDVALKSGSSAVGIAHTGTLW